MKNMNIFKEQGLSMIELLVALAISSFLILGITQVYLNNKSSYTLQQSQAANMDYARFLQMILDEQISRAGYRRSPDDGMESAFPEVTASGGCAAFSKENTVTGLSSGASGFCMRYQPAFSGELSCDGVAALLVNESAFQASKESEIVTVRIEFTPSDQLHEGTLSCNGVELITGLADFRVEFLSGPSDERRVTFSNNGIVRGLYYEALFASPPNQRIGDESPILTNWGSSAERLSKNDQRRAYQIVSSTQLLRNMVP